MEHKISILYSNSSRAEFGYMLKIQGFELDCFRLQKSVQKPYWNAATNVTF
jgi:hypothetical protein